jgi:hypothetical protein
MVVSDKQLQVMLRVLEGSLTICDRTDRNMFGFDQETRLQLYNDIINQQSNKLIDVSEHKDLSND